MRRGRPGGVAHGQRRRRGDCGHRDRFPARRSRSCSHVLHRVRGVPGRRGHGTHGPASSPLQTMRSTSSAWPRGRRSTRSRSWTVAAAASLDHHGGPRLDRRQRDPRTSDSRRQHEPRAAGNSRRQPRAACLCTRSWPRPASRSLWPPGTTARLRLAGRCRPHARGHRRSQHNGDGWHQRVRRAQARHRPHSVVFPRRMGRSTRRLASGSPYRRPAKTAKTSQGAAS